MSKNSPTAPKRSHERTINKCAQVDPPPELPGNLHRVGIAADHGGFELKQFLAGKLREAGYHVADFGDRQLKPDDDYPDFVIPLARAVAAGTVDRGIGICGSGVGASLAANKVVGVRAGLIDENFSAHQGVEDDDLNMICFGGLLVGHALAWELTQTFLAARFKGAERFCRRLQKVAQLENPTPLKENPCHQELPPTRQKQRPALHLANSKP
jgi:ribose 5-phosphate isomerase B